MALPSLCLTVSIRVRPQNLSKLNLSKLKNTKLIEDQNLSKLDYKKSRKS
jgi:hypothetical protein